MTAYLQPGDRIHLAVPDMFPGNTIADDATYWRSIYGPQGVEIINISVLNRLTHPVVVAVFRGEPSSGGER